VRGEIAAHSHEWPSDGRLWKRSRFRAAMDIALVSGVYRLLLVGDAYFLEASRLARVGRRG